MELTWLMLNDKKMIPFIEISLGQCVCELVFGVNTFDLDLGVQIDSINSQSRATLWVLETCLVVGLVPLMIILISTSLSSKIYNKASSQEEFTFEETKINIVQIIDQSMRFLSCWRFLRVSPCLIALMRVFVKN